MQSLLLVRILSLTRVWHEGYFFIFPTTISLVFIEIALFQHFFVPDGVILLPIVFYFVHLLHFHLDLLTLEPGCVGLHRYFPFIFSCFNNICQISIDYIGLLYNNLLKFCLSWQILIIILHVIHGLNHVVELLSDISTYNLEILCIRRWLSWLHQRRLKPIRCRLRIKDLGRRIANVTSVVFA